MASAVWATATTIAAAKVPGRAYGATEHPIVPHTMGTNARKIPVANDGLIDNQALDALLAEGPSLIAIQQVNNETGVIQDIDAIYERVSASGSLLLADCAQSAGKLPLPKADFIAVSAHKLGGPPGVGALLVGDLATLQAFGGQEKGYRRGTENLPGVAAFAAALEYSVVDMEGLAEHRPYLDSQIEAAGGAVIAADAPRIPTIAAYAMPSVTSASQLVQNQFAQLGTNVILVFPGGERRGDGIDRRAQLCRADATAACIRAAAAVGAEASRR